MIDGIVLCVLILAVGSSEVVKELLEISKNRGDVFADMIDTMQKLTSSVAELEIKVGCENDI